MYQTASRFPAMLASMAALLAVMQQGCVPGSIGGAGAAAKGGAEQRFGPAPVDSEQAQGGEFCSPDEAVPDVAPLRRLTPVEYENSVAVLFPDIELPEVDIGRDEEIDGFRNNALGQTASALLIEQYRDVSRAVAAQAFLAVDRWAPCAASEGSERCIVEIARDLGERAYRRPLTPDERRSLEVLATRARADHGFDVAVQLLVRGVLQAPQFLYRPEFGQQDGMSGGFLPLSGHEIATRLSYFLWRSPPDQLLTQAAADGELDTRDGIESATRRMMQDERGRESLRGFFSTWLRLERTTMYSPDSGAFPEYTPDVRTAVVESLERFIDHVFWGEGTIESLMTDRTVFVNDALADVYGLPAPGGQALVAAQFPADERAGILTQPGLLASTSHTLQHSPILRGVFVREALLCAPLPPPPANVNGAIEEMPADVPRTTRQHIAETHIQEGCLGCHEAIDGIGFAFENFDAIGRYRTEENGLSVDPSGEVIGIPGMEERRVENAIELAELLGGAQRVRDCAASHLFRFALGRSNDSVASDCQVRRLGAALGAAGGDMRELVVALTRSDFFRFRSVPQE